ncbi:hypothetical protein BUALT_Bualt11G0102000 [Buddleja alternifolia]|uniref:phosphopyruvate hydratase n=1 Tax=Buddleja alternifolia TaxID=168488 RepID=A0AAV6X4S9_9LAMI|nr:hypothetical protein BUALT_Bualt11G0102000 [Buddleja alternifolia]
MVDVHLTNGIWARAAVPSGASTGMEGSEYLGKGVSKAVSNVNTIIGPALVGKNPTDQTGLDNFMVQHLDGIGASKRKMCFLKLGANAILAVSLAVCKAGAAALDIPLYKHVANLAGNKKMVLPVPAFNVINGGSHAGNKLAMQAVIKKKYGQDATNVGDEGGFAPNIQENKEGLELLKTAIAKAGYTGKVVIGMDVAASEFYGSDRTYDLNFKEEFYSALCLLCLGRTMMDHRSGDQLKGVYKSFVSEYPIVSIEDPFDQDDWEHDGKLTGEIGSQVQIVGDDLLVTNPKRVEKGIKENTCNALLLKVNKIGSVTEMEREDTFIADLSVGLSTGQIKTGAPCRSERLAKYNELLRIEEELGSEAVYAGASFRASVEPY